MHGVRSVLFVGICVAIAYSTDKDSNELPDFADQILEKSNLLNPKGDAKYKEKKEKFKKSAESVKDAKEKFKKLGNEDVASAINGVGEGLTQLVSGISSGSWQDMLLGGLSIVGTLASLAGPMGAALSTVLSLVSMVFGLFGGSQAAEESQEGMLKRVIDEALTRARADELRAEAEGLKKAVSSIRNSINQFRDENSITENQATELYNQAFRGLNFFGQLKFYIDKYCDCSVEDLKDNVKLSTARKNSDRCLEFLNLYSDLSILRQLLIADMASLVGSVGLNGTARNLLSLTEKEKISDKDILLFLLNPINNKQQRFCIAQYFGAPGKYPTLQAYLASLTLSSTGEDTTKQVVICSEKELLGLCYKLEPRKHNKEDLLEWDRAIKSLYVSEGLVVTGFSKDNFTGISHGPFPGATVVGLISGDWKSINISHHKEKREHVRVCENEKLSQDGRCDELEIEDYATLKMVTGYEGDIMTEKGKKCIFPFIYEDKVYNKCTNIKHDNYWCATSVDENNHYMSNQYENCVFPQTWSEKILSISIPENIQVYLYTEEDYQGTEYGPFYGSNTIDKVCGNRTTKSMKISKSNKKSSEMVKICRGASFSRLCDFIDIGDYEKLIIHGCFWYNEENKIKSMRVPGGLAVYMWTRENFEGLPLGPYIGPVTLPVVDGGEPSQESNKSQIKSLKIVRHNPLSDVYVKRKIAEENTEEDENEE